MRRCFATGMSLFALLLLGACSYAVDGVRYLTQEDYVSGGEAQYRLQSAVLLGYGLRYQNNPQADFVSAYIAFLATRVKDDRDYLETSIASCEEILFVAGAAALTPEQAVQAGLYCNLGPGKRPDEL